MWRRWSAGGQPGPACSAGDWLRPAGRPAVAANLVAARWLLALACPLPHPTAFLPVPPSPQVLHLRDYPFATLCELCEQSMHAFVSFNTVASTPPSLKVPPACADPAPPARSGAVDWRLRGSARCHPLPALPGSPCLTWFLTPLPVPRGTAPVPPGVLQRLRPGVGAGQLLLDGEGGGALLGELPLPPHAVPRCAPHHPITAQCMPALLFPPLSGPLARLRPSPPHCRSWACSLRRLCRQMAQTPG